MNMFDSPILSILRTGLDATSMRQRVIANNVANVNTPGFKKSVVSFEDHLKAALEGGGGPLKGTHPLHIEASNEQLTPEVKQVRDTSMRFDGNNVDIDQEMVNLAATTVEYDLIAQGVSDRLNILGAVISGRG